MAFRRPPTRVELKAEDIEEYDTILREKQLASREETPSMNEKGFAQRSSALDPVEKRKSHVAERIGLKKSR